MRKTRLSRPPTRKHNEHTSNYSFLPDISKITSASTDAEISAAEAAVRATAIPGDNAGQVP
jgi:hypothetical protein